MNNAQLIDHLRRLHNVTAAILEEWDNRHQQPPAPRKRRNLKKLREAELDVALATGSWKKPAHLKKKS